MRARIGFRAFYDPPEYTLAEKGALSPLADGRERKGPTIIHWKNLKFGFVSRSGAIGAGSPSSLMKRAATRRASLSLHPFPSSFLEECVFSS